MSLMSHLAHRAALRRGLLGGLGALALLAAGSPSASAAKLTLTYQCTFPVTGEQPVTMELSGAFPVTEFRGMPTAPVDLEARITAGGDALTGYRLLGAATLEGTASIGVRVTAPNFALPVTVPATVPVTPVPATGPLVFTARGTVPSFQLPSLGTGSIAIEQVSLRLVARRADGTILQPIPAPGVDDLPAEIPCRLDPATLNPTLARFNVGGDDFAPGVPGAPRLTANTTTSLTLAWDASSGPLGDPGNLSYEVWGATSITPDGQPVGKILLATTPSPGAILTGLDPGTTYTVVVRAVGASGQSAFTSPVPLSTAPEVIVDTAAPSAPTGVRADQVQSEYARIVWSAPDAVEGVTTYRAYNGAIEVGSAPANTANTMVVRNLLPETTYTLTLKAFDAAGNPSEASDPVTFTTAPGVGIDPYRYDLAGAATLKTLTKGTVSLSGGSVVDVKLATGELTADLTLAPTTAKLVTLGFLPITADIAFVSTAPTTGTLVKGVLSTNSKVRIKLPRVSLFGLQLAGGANCQTKTVSNIALKSTDAFFAPLSGGSLAGTFAISDLTGCGALTGLVSPLTAGKGNAIALKLTPKA